MKPILTYEDIDVGETYGPLSFRITNELVAAYLNGAGLRRPLSQIKDFGALVDVDPTHVFCQHGYLNRTKYYLKATVLAKSWGRWLLPYKLGQSYSVEGEVFDKYIRRGGKYITISHRTHDANGDLVSEAKNTRLMNYKEMKAQRSSTDSATAKSASGSAQIVSSSLPIDVVVNANTSLELRLGPVVISQTHLMQLEAGESSAYGGTKPSNLHNDPELSASLGFQATLVPGRLLSTMISQLLAAHFGSGWYAGGEMSVSYTRPVYPDVPMYAVANVVNAEADVSGKLRVHLHVEVVDVNDKVLAVGKASGLAVMDSQSRNDD